MAQWLLNGAKLDTLICQSMKLSGKSVKAKIAQHMMDKKSRFFRAQINCNATWNVECKVGNLPKFPGESSRRKVLFWIYSVLLDYRFIALHELPDSHYLASLMQTIFVCTLKGG